MNEQELIKLGYKLTWNADGYRVDYKDQFVASSGVNLPRTKKLHWKHAQANRKEFHEYALITALQDAQKRGLAPHFIGIDPS